MVRDGVDNNLGQAYIRRKGDLTNMECESSSNLEKSAWPSMALFGCSRIIAQASKSERGGSGCLLDMRP